jgi:DNA-binding MarR family transcriptional regulator
MDVCKMLPELLRSINHLLALDNNDDAEKQQVLEQATDPQLKALDGQLSTRDVLIIATVAQGEPYPQKALPAQVNTSQPTASRAVERLVKLGLLQRQRIPSNQKEWQLTLTALGQKVAAAKQALNQNLQQQAEVVASHYTPEELKRFDQFINELIALKTPR